MALQDIQIDWLKCFVAVVDSGSLSAAAPMVHRSQSAVSMQLKKLEQVLNTQLLLRGPRQLALTEDGKKLLGYARRMLDLHNETRRAFDGEELTGRIRLGAPDDYAPKYLTPVLKRFTPLHDQVDIELVCEQSSALIPKIERGDIDIGLVSKARPHQGTPLFHEPMVWVGSPHFEIWRKNPLPIAVYEEESLAHTAAIRSLAQQGRDYRIVYSSSSVTGQIAAVESGLAIAVFTRCIVPPHLEILGSEHNLGPLEPMQVAVYRSPLSQNDKAVSRFHDLLVETFRAESP